ncbi:unnamed protein product [Lupinus luteus]|uniref:Transmembrane protein n=1 Tax=Lupinus luteus TaxID=3873 RepID=A0AAV1WDF3_LUPLU
MATKVTLFSPFPFKTSPFPNSPSLLNITLPSSNTNLRPALKIHAKLGGADEDMNKGGKKKFITKDEEPQQYWQTAGEREGENPMKTPLPYIIIFGMSTPFVILAIAFANGWIKVPIR